MIEVLPAGERGLLVEVGASAVLDFASAARDRWQGSLAEVVPGDRTVLLVWTEDPPDAAEVAAVAADSEARPTPEQARSITIEVRYDGPDLHEAAALARLSVEELVARHQACEYTAAFSGFAPGFAYLRGDDPKLELPRRAEPRTEVPAGAVALGGGYCAVYPRTSPGGWLLIGTTEATMFDSARPRPALVSPGDAVRFEEVGG